MDSSEREVLRIGKTVVARLSRAEGLAEAAAGVEVSQESTDRQASRVRSSRTSSGISCSAMAVNQRSGRCSARSRLGPR